MKKVSNKDVGNSQRFKAEVCANMNKKSNNYSSLQRYKRFSLVPVSFSTDAGTPLFVVFGRPDQS